MKVFVKKRALDSCLEGARNLYPDEFLGLLRGIVEVRGVVVGELVLAPLTEYNETSSSYSPLLVPANSSIVGSFHSHPSLRGEGGLRPSRADLELFSKTGFAHLIACRPFSRDCVAAFDKKGKEVELVVE